MATFQPPPLREKIITEAGLSSMWRTWFNLIQRALAQILTIPTGTGFRHVTGGVEDAAAKLVENADVHATAGIVESKLTFNITTGHDHDGASSKKVDHGNLTGLADDDHTQYIKHSLATAANDFLVASGAGAFVKKTLAETRTILSLPALNYAVGDLLYADTTTTLAKLADVAAGAYLRSGGVGVAPLWSTLILPNAATAYRLPVATGANTIGELAAVGATGEYLKGNTGAIPSWATLNQAAVAGLTTTDGPTFAHLHLSDLAAIYVVAESWIGPSSTTGIYFKDGRVGIGTTNPSAGKLQIGNTDGAAVATNPANLFINDRNTAGPNVDNTGIELSTYIGAGSEGYGAKLYTNSASQTFGIATRFAALTWTERFVIHQPTGNVGIGTTVFGTSAAVVLGLGFGTAPTTTPANMAQMWVEDINAAAGYAGLHKMTETTAQKEVVPGVIIKTTTGSPANPYEGLMEINTFDNKIRMYGDAGWRELGTW